MRSSDIDIFVALYGSDRTYLRLNYHVEVTRERVEMYPFN